PADLPDGAPSRARARPRGRRAGAAEPRAVGARRPPHVLRGAPEAGRRAPPDPRILRRGHPPPSDRHLPDDPRGAGAPGRRPRRHRRLTRGAVGTGPPVLIAKAISSQGRPSRRGLALSSRLRPVLTAATGRKAFGLAPGE